MSCRRSRWRRCGGGTAAPTPASRCPASRPSRAALLAARLFGVGAFAAAVVFYVFPDTAIDLWPWQLTPLTSRVLGAFTAQVGAGALLLSTDARWGSWRLIVETFFVAVGLLLVGAARAWYDFDDRNPLTYLTWAGWPGRRWHSRCCTGGWSAL